MTSCEKPDHGKPPVDRSCCIADTGCNFRGRMDKVVGECIFVDKVYDGITLNLQGLQAGNKISFGHLPVSRCGGGARIVRVKSITARRFFNPENINDSRNLIITPITTLSGAQFVTDCKGNPVTVPGPAGLLQYLIYTNTASCDAKSRGTPIFGSQEIHVTGCISVSMVVDFEDNRGRVHETTLSARMPVNQTITNFFELCMPSVFDSTFLPQFTEFCNISFSPRLATRGVSMDVSLNSTTGEVTANLVVALCITCEKKIKVPAQLCVLSTGFCEHPVSPREILCPSFPPLFPPQVNIPHIKPYEDEICIESQEDESE